MGLMAGHIVIDIAELRIESGYWYLGSPYSKWPTGLEDAFRVACRLTGRLISLGVPVYSPIAHTHPVAIYSEMDPYDHAIWMPADRPMMDGAYGLIVAMMSTWRESYGLAEEVRIFGEAGKPILYLDPERAL